MVEADRRHIGTTILSVTEVVVEENHRDEYEDDVTYSYYQKFGGKGSRTAK